MERQDERPFGLFESLRAMEEYRKAWARYSALTGGAVFLDPAESEAKQTLAKSLQATMDALQLRICRGPGAVWRAFTDTLPGYRDAWNNVIPEVIEKFVADSREP